MKEADNIRNVAALTPMMMGFIFYPESPRYVGDLDADVVRSLPGHVRPVGVFVNSEEHEVVGICWRYGIKIAQLHGNESPAMCSSLRRQGFTVFKAVGIATAADFSVLAEYEGCVDMFLFDTKSPLHGGTGCKFDHSLLDKYVLDVPYLLSGGIGPDDVDSVVSAMRPGMAGIDINSRFEIAPGVKNLRALIQFILSLRSFNEYESDNTPFWEK
ncbi:phosphoribosylanthranilate isomerase [Muribaculum sp.]|uniref:phosphoribosylanthranilate isomerase n=1 Tax=Muribaculum sp. TaxID=1918611 RepID=UPI0023CE2977|nr:phosphoribosylanthranilate isomerase [Muribaculum sp.]MDE5706187.1 phosphoribosylanthranilate isomerase [Muribaculum sp.]